MAQNTWNFPCWQTHDWGTFDTGARNRHGLVWAIGPAIVGAVNQPFGESLTAVFSLLHRSGGWSADGGEVHGLISIGDASSTDAGFKIYCASSPLRLYVSVWNKSITTYRYQIQLGDEDGVNWLSSDKWYQCGLSITATGISWVVNGSTTPTSVETTNSPGSLGLATTNERIWVHNSRANSGQTATQLQAEFPSLVLGPAMYMTTALDFTSATVRDRIWDTNGDFKNPGEDFSLWLGDTYGATQPEFAFVDGSPRFDAGTYNASIPQSWQVYDGGGSGSSTSPGGLRKQYE